jgi:broad specificity phosphatase PhoE
MTSPDREAHNAVEVDRWHRGLEPRIEGYENHDAVIARVMAAIEEAVARPGDVVIVGHGSTSRMAVRVMLELPLDGHSIGPLGNASWAELAHNSAGATWRLLRYNASA